MKRDKDGTDKNKALMLARGSKTGAYDADAPDQWKFNLRHGQGEVKAIAWVQSQTIALGHESPWCVDEHGKPTWIEHMALACGWEEQTARNYLNKLERQGRVRLDHKAKRIWYCADVPLAHAELPAGLEEDAEPEEPEEPDCTNMQQGRTDGETFNSVQSYRERFINNLDPKKRHEARNKMARFSEWKEGFINDGVAALRSIADEVEDITWQKIGVPKKRLAKRRPPESQWVQLNFLEDPNFVQSCAEFVQSGESTLYKLEIKPFKFVQTEGESCVSFMGSTPASTPTKPLTPAPSPPSSSPPPVKNQEQRTTTTTLPRSDLDDVVVIVNRLAIKGSAARKFLAACRQSSPGSTIEQIVAVIDQVDQSINRQKYANPTGILLENVPLRLAAQSKTAEPAAGPKCRICRKPLGDGVVVDGSHYECGEAAEVAGKAVGND